MLLSKVKCALIVVLVLGAERLGSQAASSAPAQAANDSSGQAGLANRLKQTVDYPGLDDARATFADALDHLSKRYGITFHVNEQAFHAIDPKIDALRFMIAEKAIPAMRVPLKTVLRTILERLPSKMKPMYVIRKEHVEITTEAAVRAEMGIAANRPLLPLVWERLGNTPIAVALRRLADQSGHNVIVDPRVAEKLQTSATLEFNNVPVDTAVRLLANLAGLSMVRLDNVLFVTTVDNAKQLREEQVQANADKPARDAEPPKKPAPEKPAK